MRCVLSVAIFAATCAWGADDSSPAAKAIVDKGIKALGGIENLTKFKAGTWKGKGAITLFGAEVPFVGEYAFQLPEQMKVSLLIESMDMKVTFITVLNGPKGWSNVGNMTLPLDKEGLNENKERMHALWAQMLTPLLDGKFALSTLEDGELEGRRIVGVKAAFAGRRDVELWFDAATGMRVKSVTKVKDELTRKEEKEETYYTDYTDFGGVKHPRKVIVKRNGKTLLEVNVAEYKPAEKLDDSHFGEP